MFAADSLGATGPSNAVITITGPALNGGIPGPVDLAFDASGNLWVAVLALDKVVRFTADQLLASGEPVPAVEISGAAIEGPGALAFDAAGNLWIAATGPSDVVRYDASRLAASTGMPAFHPAPAFSPLYDALP